MVASLGEQDDRHGGGDDDHRGGDTETECSVQVVMVAHAGSVAACPAVVG